MKAVFDRYSSLAKQWGEPVALEAFGLGPEETISLFTSLDDDYHISRFLHFSCGAGRHYPIAGEEVTHISVDAGISPLL